MTDYSVELLYYTLRRLLYFLQVKSESPGASCECNEAAKPADLTYYLDFILEHGIVQAENMPSASKWVESIVMSPSIDPVVNETIHSVINRYM